MAIFWYLFKVSVCITVFYSFYTLALRKSTFFSLNRFYLILGVITSFAIPVLNISILPTQSDTILSAIIYPDLMETEYTSFQLQNLSDHATMINYTLGLSIIYLTGVLFLFLRLLFSVKRIIYVKNKATTFRIGKIKVVKTDSELPFSFFNLIFLSKNGNEKMIISHEIAHIKQCHWLDLLLMETTVMLLWFNPIIFFYKRSLKLQHEYLADANITKNENQIEQYLYCLLKHIQGMNCGAITNQFYGKTIKKRIIMITKEKTSNAFLGVYFLVFPLLFLIFFVFSDHKVLAQEIVVLNPIPSEKAIQNNRNQPSIYPIDSKKVKGISDYGERVNPITGKKSFHSGVDLAVPEGEKVLSTAAGLVIEAKFDSKKGNYIIIQHNELFSTFYSHLESLSVEKGDRFKKGEFVGYSGNTGLSTGSHLHYEVLKNGRHVNPKDYLPQ